MLALPQVHEPCRKLVWTGKVYGHFASPTCRSGCAQMKQEHMGFEAPTGALLHEHMSLVFSEADVGRGYAYFRHAHAWSRSHAHHHVVMHARLHTHASHGCHYAACQHAPADQPHNTSGATLQKCFASTCGAHRFTMQLNVWCICIVSVPSNTMSRFSSKKELSELGVTDERSTDRNTCGMKAPSPELPSADRAPKPYPNLNPTLFEAY